MRPVWFDPGVRVSTKGGVWLGKLTRMPGRPGKVAKLTKTVPEGQSKLSQDTRSGH